MPAPALGPPKIVVATLPVPGAPPIATDALTDAQLRAVAVPFSAVALPLPLGASSEATLVAIGALLTLIKAKTDNLDVVLSTRAVTGLTDAELRATNVPVVQKPTNLWVTATGAVNTGVTCTLPAPGAGLFHYITSIELVKLYAVLGVANGAGVIITSTNLSGNPIWTCEQVAGPVGTTKLPVSLNFAGNPLKSVVANTATTLVAPAQLQTIWRWNVSYYTGP